MSANGDLHVEVSGNPDGRALVFLHPLGGSTRFWDDCIEPFRADWRLVAYDRRGAGRSPNPPGPWSVGQHAEDLEEIRREIGLSRMVLVGAAIGAMIAVSYAASYPEHVAGLLLSNPSAAVAEEGRRILRSRAEAVRSLGVEGLLPGAVDTAFHGMEKDDRYRAYLDQFRGNDPIGYERSLLGLMDADVRACLPAIDVPTHVVVGRHDILHPPAVAREIASAIRNATFTELVDAAHFPAYQATGDFVAELGSFLKTIN